MGIVLLLNIVTASHTLGRRCVVVVVPSNEYKYNSGWWTHVGRRSTWLSDWSYELDYLPKPATRTN